MESQKLDIKVLGPGCSNCIKLENLVKEVIAEKNIPANVEKVTAPEKFWEYGILLTPALVVNGKVLISGKVPTKSTFEHWLEEYIAENH
ncbi:MAG: thioredoxin family protein [Candidatus Kapaibacteriales bacterium]